MSSLVVFFDGGCPLCEREIGVYRRASEGNANVVWSDVNSDHTTFPENLSREAALKRFHVLVNESSRATLLSGAEAFTALWKHIPGWTWLGRIGSLPFLLPILELMYVAFLQVRPFVQKVVRALSPATSQAPAALVADLRSDHAGETGAVWIYRGILVLARGESQKQLRDFALHHLETEQKHLSLMEGILPWRQRSRLLPFWRIAGFATGFLPALFGSRAVFATIEAVETFVDQHYQDQIDRPEMHAYPGLRNTLASCQQDERDHRDDAAARIIVPAGIFLRIWCAVVGIGSAQAVKLARVI